MHYYKLSESVYANFNLSGVFLLIKLHIASVFIKTLAR